MSNEPKRKSTRGPVSDEIKKWIVDHTSEFSVPDMAEKFNLKVETVDKIIAAFSGTADKNFEWRERLKKSVSWKQIRKELDEDEIDYFVNKYMALAQQFKDDMFATEEQQVFNIIRIEILMSRCLQAKQELRASAQTIVRIKEALLEQYEGDLSQMPPEELEHLAEYEEQITGTRQAENSRTSEYTNLQKEHNTLTNGLKASRQQRIEKIDNNNVSFTTYAKNLMERDVQERESRQIVLGQMSMKKELKRLGTPHEYLNKEVDLPILCAETQEMLKENEDAEE